MKILQIQKFNYMLGGGSRYYFELTKLLRNQGHQVSLFCVNHEENAPSAWSKFFISNVSYERNDITNRLKLISRMLYSTEAKDKIKKLLSQVRPDIVHLHDIYHHISPSILPVIKSFGIPIVAHLGDYHLISPNYHMYHDGNICEITKPDRFYKAFFHRCVKHSYVASLAEVVEKYLHTFWGWEKDMVDLFLVPSNFMVKKLVEYGIPAKKIIHLPHFIDASKYDRKRTDGEYILYFGRLSDEKGLMFLLGVMKHLPHISLKIVGRGPLEPFLKLEIAKNKLTHVELCGFMDGQRLKNIIATSRFTVLPSLWYEVFGLSILESFACGKPVIACNIGGIPEAVFHGYNGLLFEAGNIQACLDAIAQLWENKTLCKTMGQNARLDALKRFSPDNHYSKLMKLYSDAINQRYLK